MQLIQFPFSRHLIGERLMLQALVMLHASNPDCWHRLGDVYGTTDTRKQAACYVRARWVLEGSVIQHHFSLVSFVHKQKTSNASFRG